MHKNSLGKIAALGLGLCAVLFMAAIPTTHWYSFSSTDATSVGTDYVRMCRVDGDTVTDIAEPASEIPIAASQISSGTLPIARGGTGATSLASGYVPYSSGGTAYSASPITVSGVNVGFGGTPVDLLQINRLESGKQNGRVQLGHDTVGAKVGYSQTGSGRTFLTNLNNSGGTANLISIGFGAVTNGVPANPIVTMDQTGCFGLGATSFGTSAATVLGIANGTAPASSPANMVQLYAEDVSSSSELKVRDEAGNVTTLSPHPHDAPESLAYFGSGLDEFSASRNHYKGECYWFNLSKWYFDDTATKADCRMIETFAEYNTRRGLSEGDAGYLVAESWDAAEAEKVQLANLKRHEWQAKAENERGEKPRAHKARHKPEWLR